jgi:D-arginine dehydrogenase
VIDGGAACYFRPEGAARLLASPGDETPVQPGDARPDELAIAQALDKINELVNVTLRRVTHAWAGLRTFAPDHEPVVGPAPRDPSFIFVAGQGGYGIQMAPAVAALATQILGTGNASSPELSALRSLTAPRAPR